MVDEQKTTEGEKTETKPNSLRTGNRTEETNPIIATNAAAKRLEEANRKAEELLKREEMLEVSRRLGGHSEAGAIPVKPKEETPEEYKDRVMRNEI